MAVCYRQLHSVPSRTTPKLDGYFPSKGPPKILQSGPGRGRYKSKPTLAGSGVCDGHTEITSSHFNYREVKGDLFSCSATASLAHCVSEDFHMGKGIAALFKKQFGGVAKLREQGVAIVFHTAKWNCMFVLRLFSCDFRCYNRGRCSLGERRALCLLPCEQFTTMFAHFY